MAGKKSIRWLYNELPGLVGKGVLGEKQADALKEHYGPVADIGGRKVALVVFSIIGSLLIGTGVILLLAHNWSQLSRPARTFLAIAPLLGAQAFGLSVMRKGLGVAMRESAATFISLLFASAVAIIGQTYHIGGDLGGFLLTCSICILPLAFVMDAVMPAALYMGAITGWVGYQRSNDESVYFFWLLLIPLIIKYVQMVKADRYAGRAVFLSWVMAICLPIATGFIQEYSIDGAWIVVFSSVFGFMYLASKKWFADAETVWVAPFKAIGGAGIMVMSFMLTYDFCWDEIRYSYSWQDFGGVDFMMMLLPVVGVVLLAVPLFVKKRFMEAVTGVMPLLAAVGFLLITLSGGVEEIGMVIFNVYLLVLSITKIASGLKRESIGSLNGGMLMLGLLIMLRFIDSDMEFLAKGITFILLGAGFLAVNVMMLRKKKEVAK